MSKIPLLISPRSSSVPALPSDLSKSTCSVSPRAGSFIPRLPSDENTNKKIYSRGGRIKKCLEEPQFTFKKSKVRLDECDEMLAVTISCVMMMAANSINIPKEYFIWADNYLSRIKDDMGENPPNVKGILNHIALLRPDLVGLKAGICRCNEELIKEAETEEDDEMIETSKTEDDA